ncbi:MAG: hypothetical protein F6K09_13245 [Merismopedia sp. SIO2A8]|nr:hypothetical protein [Symploca sp. SIO2B6]NET49659.1 hypothetical protein [Merismopedia sp. SIO2A8]
MATATAAQNTDSKIEPTLKQRPADLTEVQWQTVHAIAYDLADSKMDVNEFKKVIAYLRNAIATHVHPATEDAERQQQEAAIGANFFNYLKTLVRHGNTIGHSKCTKGYYKTLDDVCRDYLSPYQTHASTMLVILGWTARLVKYYDQGVPTGETSRPTVTSEREAEIQAITQANTFEVGQELEAIATTIKGNKVTYEILGTIKLSQKEPKLASKLTEGQTVAVTIQSLRDDGSIKKVKGKQ